MINGYSAEIRQKWEDIGGHENGSVRIRTINPLQWFAYSSKDSEKAVLVRLPERPVSFKGTRSIGVSTLKGGDGWSLILSLLDPKQEEVFLNMISDLISCSEVSSKEQAQKKLTARYLQWFRLLAYGHSSIMTEAQQKGILGELLFLKKILQSGMKPMAAVQGWMGPEKADQDFIYDSAWYEIKSIGFSSDMVTISSLQQLDCSSDGYLVVYRIEKTAPESPDGLTLRQAAHSIMISLDDVPEAEELFTEKLNKAGYLDSEQYDRIHFLFRSCQKYLVDSSFPRLTPQSVPNGLVRAEYSLSLSTLETFKADD